MAGILERISNIFFQQEETAETPQEGHNSPAHTAWEEQDNSRKYSKKGNLISIPGRNQTATEMILIKATNYEDLENIAQNIKERKIVVVNFEEMDKEVAQRMVDFLSGAAFALNGHPKKVSWGTFIFSSTNVDLSGQIMDTDIPGKPAEDSGKNRTYSWMKKS
ncbi:MAG: cell division protein SepF [Clostridiales bacterium]|nr:cell division protein SepF [Clostridiales bacterium]